MGGKGSGKPRYSREVHETIVRHLKAGAFKKVAAQAAGVSADAMKDWVERGLAGEKRYRQFALDVQKAEADDIIRNQAMITKAALSDWKAAAWNLERKYPKLYGRNLNPSVGVSIGSDDRDGEEGGGTRTRVEFYLPDNGRRPHDIGDETVEDEEA